MLKYIKTKKLLVKGNAAINYRRYYIILIVFLLMFQSLAFVAFAKPQALKITPLTLRYSLKRLEKSSGSISIINPNRFAIKVQTETEDFIQGDEAGTPQFLPKGSGITSLANWIKFDQKEISLDPLETKDATFKITVPKDAEPGGHYAAVFAKSVPIKGKGQNTISISGRVGTLILVTVPGAIVQTGKIIDYTGPKFVNSGPIDFLLRFKNTGTVHYQPKGTIKISSMFKKEVKTLSLEPHFVLPKSVRKYNKQWITGSGFGIFNADVELIDGEGKTLKDSIKFVMFPWQQSLMILGGIILVFWARKNFRTKFQIVRKED